MRLLYLYVSHWESRGISPDCPLEYNFITGYLFRMSGVRLSLEVGKHLPDRFFSVQNFMPGRGQVDAVSAIIGPNGSGKTSCAAVLSRLFRRGRPRPYYVCVYEEGSDLLVYANLGTKLQDEEVAKVVQSLGKRWIRVDDDNALPQDRANISDVTVYEHPFDVIYYSPYLGAEDLWREEARDGFYDASTGHYLQTRALDKINLTKEASYLDVVAKFTLFTTQSILEFAHAYLELFGKASHVRGRLVAPDLPLPRFARIRVDGIRLMKQEAPYGKQKDAKPNRQVITNKQYLRACTVICSQYESDIAWRFVSELLLSYMEILPVEESLCDDDPAAEILISVCEQIRSGELKAKEKLIIDDLLVKGQKALDYSRLKFVVEKLASYSYRTDAESSSTLGSLKVGIGRREALDDVIEMAYSAMMIWRDVPAGVHCCPLSVSLANMSSGEMAYWTLFSRIYSVLPNGHKSVDRKSRRDRNVLVFFDESETTLHPEWQRCIVQNVIWFFETMTKGLHVHVVFASHSPILLSDIPRGNVVYLDDEIKVRGHQLANTFAANIFDLYQHSFMLAGGPTGEFARNRVSAALRDLADCISKSKPVDPKMLEIFSLVGDPAILAYLDHLRKVGLLCCR